LASAIPRKRATGLRVEPSGDQSGSSGPSPSSPRRRVICGSSDTGVRSVPKLDDFENTFLLCYVRGPEGLIVELAERLDSAPG
jgi:hypothetical protein